MESLLRTPRTLCWIAALALMVLALAGCGADDDGDGNGDQAGEDPAAGEDDDAADSGDDGGEDADGEDFPTDELTFLVPFPAGSAPDVTFRQLSELAEAELGQRIVVVNREGGAGTVGNGELAEAEPDGYTIGMGASATVSLKPEMQDTTYTGFEDFEPIMNATSATFVLFSPAGREYGDLDGFVADARERPGELTLGLPGEFGLPHLQVEILRSEADVDFEVVFLGAGEQVTATINETVDAAVAQPRIVLEHEADGTVEVLGLVSPRPLEAVDVPLFTDQGYDVDVVPSEFVIGPAGIPEDRVQILHDAYKAAFDSEEFQEYLADSLILDDYLGPEDLRQRLEEEAGFYAGYVEEFNWSE